MKCPKCQHENPEDAKFCQECGNKLFGASKTVKTSSIPEAERKRVTALFSDLSGYTSMTEKLDPEEVKEITGRIFNGVKAVVRKYEGFIEKFLGDGVLALFGVPRAHEDDPIRAIRAALEIHAIVETLSPRYETKIGRALSMHSGINTGLVVTADVNPEKGTHSVTGETINVAARLSGLAEARDILVGPDTYRASQSQFTFQPLKPTKVKGKSEHIPIYKVLSEKTATALVSQEMQVSSEMIGRDQELAKLELHILKAVNGQGSVVNVFGEPGIGKARLLAELRQREVISRVKFLEGRSISIGKNLSFHPIIDLYKQWAKIKEDDTQTEVSNKLETAIRRVCGDETDEVFPFVATMMGMKLSGKHSQRVEGIEGEALEKLILKNVRELLIRSSELIPIVIVMEDLHWADTTSLELLESLFRLALTHRVVFINVFRPGYWQRDDRKVETLPEWLPELDFAEIAIKPLGKQTGEAMVNNMLQVKGLRYAVKQKIVDRSGGNPFFIEEIVLSLIDEGAIVRTNGAFEVTEKINSVVIPPTINDVLTARIDQLEEQTRDLIKVASVIGRSFFYRILKEVANSIEGVDERLAYLKDAQFIRDRMRMEELEYLFKHALAQETAYESTLLQQRKELHLKVAQSIEKIFRERLHEFYGMLAHHYSMGEDEEKAEEYLIKAGEEALKSSASSEALYYFKDAIKLYTKRYGDAVDPNKMAQFEENVAFAFFNRGHHAEAIVYFDKTLNSLGFKEQKNKIFILIELIINLLNIVKDLYLPSIRRKKAPTSLDNKVLNIYLAKGQSLASVDAKRFFTDMIMGIKKCLKFDPSKSQ
ncbi:MAG: adenylate/guanylate cyclase domain-containing protein, partial [ANME-2 cluster archaeon]